MPSVRFVDSAAQIPQALWSACFPPPLEGFWWYRTLESAGLEDQFTFAYAVIEDEAEPVGIAPVFAMNLPLTVMLPDALQPLAAFFARLAPSLMRPRTLFLGSPCADEGSVGLSAHVDRKAVLLRLQDALERKAAELGAGILVWKDFPSSYDEDLAALAAGRRLFRMVSFPGTLVALPSRKDDYFAALTLSRRQNLRRKLRRSAEQVEVETQAIQRPDARTIEEIFALFWQTYQRATTKFERLNRRFFELIATEPVSHFIILREKRSGEMLAFMLCFLTGDRVINKFIGLDYRRPPKWFLYDRLWDAAVDWALARGAVSIQSGQTGYSGKLATGHRLVPLNSYVRHRNVAVHALYRAVARNIGWQTLDRDLALHLSAHPGDMDGDGTARIKPTE